MENQTLLLTRPTRAAEQFVARLKQDLLDHVRIIYSPLIDIVALDASPDISRYCGVIFTSGHGVRFAPAGNGKPAYCVGVETANTARLAGWDVQITMQDADTLVASLRDLPIGRLLHLCGHHRRGQVAERLNALGHDVDVYALYDQKLLPLSETAKSVLSGEGKVIVPLFSPRTAVQFSRQMNDNKNVTVLAMSDAVAQGLANVKFDKLLIAKAPTAHEMVAGVEKLLRQCGLP